MRVLLHCQRELIANAFEDLLQAHVEGVETVIRADGRNLREMCAEQRISLVVILLPGSCPPAVEALIAKLTSHDPGTAVVVIASDFGQVLPAFAGRHSTATLLCDDTREDVRYAVHKVMAGQSVISPRLVAPVIATATVYDSMPAINTLTQREREVLHLLGKGRTNREIARGLHLSETTVKSYVSKVLEKLGKRDRVEGALLAKQMDLLQVVPADATATR